MTLFIKYEINSYPLVECVEQKLSQMTYSCDAFTCFSHRLMWQPLLLSFIDKERNLVITLALPLLRRGSIDFWCRLPPSVLIRLLVARLRSSARGN